MGIHGFWHLACLRHICHYSMYRQAILMIHVQLKKDLLCCDLLWDDCPLVVMKCNLFSSHSYFSYLRTSFNLYNHYSFKSTPIGAMPKWPNHELDPWKQPREHSHMRAKFRSGQAEVSCSRSKSGRTMMTVIPRTLSVTRTHTLNIH